MERHIIIGDVHGCNVELKELLDKLDLQYKDTVVFVGDLIHKGPESNKCFNIALDLGTNDWEHITKAKIHRSVIVQGNHEEKHARWLKVEKRSGPNLMKHVEHFAETNLPNAIIPIVEQMPFWYQFWSGGRPFVVTHGGFPPNIEFLPLQEELQKLSKSKQSRFAQVMRTRYITQEGNPAKLSKEKLTDIYWAELYDGRCGHCFFGHQVFHQSLPREYPYCTALDLGCVYGGYLCAAVVEDGIVTYETVQAHQKYTPFVHWAKRRPT